MLQTISALKM